LTSFCLKYADEGTGNHFYRLIAKVYKPSIRQNPAYYIINTVMMTNAMDVTVI